ncbi:MAG: trigger factor [Baekduia sp.]|nr:trigger factor [Baekduia sp.]
MQTTLERLDGDRIRIRVEVSTHDVDHAFEHAISDLAKSTRVPGFRPGKAPATALRARLGNEAIIAEALDGHLSRWYGRALDQAGVEPVDRPTIDYEVPPVEGEPWTFTAEVAVAPSATLPKKLVLEAGRHDAEVPPGAVDERVERMRNLAVQLEPVGDAGAEIGMVALIDFVSTVNGKKVRDGSATDYQVELGTGRLLDGLEEAIVGMREGETREATTVLPAEADKKFAGKEALFTITLKELKRRILPELDDSFAKDVSEFETLAELRADIERQIRERAEQAVDGEYRNAVLIALGEAATVEIPSVMVERRVQDRLETIARTFARRGMRLEQYLQMTGQTLEEIVADLRPDAEASARQELALKAFADREKVAPTDDELGAFVLEQATAEGEQDPAETTRKVLESPAARESLREELRLKMALDKAVEIAKPVPITVAAAVEEDGSNADAESATPGLWLPGDPK